MNNLTEQLEQLKAITWDGNLISKQNRNELRKRGYISNYRGFNYLTRKGVKLLVDLEMIRAE